MIAQQAVAMDYLAPVIELMQVGSKQSRSHALNVFAQVKDDDDLSYVKVFFREINSTRGFNSLNMRPSTKHKSLYYVSMPDSLLQLSGIEYFIEAEDRGSNRSQQPTPEAPKRLAFFGAISNKSKIPAVDPYSYYRIFTNYGFTLNEAVFKAKESNGDTHNISEPSLGLFIETSIDRYMSILFEYGRHSIVVPDSAPEGELTMNSTYLDIVFNRQYRKYWLGCGINVAKVTEENLAGSDDYTHQSLLLSSGYRLLNKDKYSLAISGKLLGLTDTDGPMSLTVALKTAF